MYIIWSIFLIFSGCTWLQPIDSRPIQPPVTQEEMHVDRPIQPPVTQEEMQVEDSEYRATVTQEEIYGDHTFRRPIHFGKNARVYIPGRGLVLVREALYDAPSANPSAQITIGEITLSVEPGDTLRVMIIGREVTKEEE